MDSLVVNVERGCEAAGRAKQLALAGRWGYKPPRFNKGGRGGAALHSADQSRAKSGSIAAFRCCMAPSSRVSSDLAAIQLGGVFDLNGAQAGPVSAFSNPTV